MVIVLTEIINEIDDAILTEKDDTMNFQNFLESFSQFLELMFVIKPKYKSGLAKYKLNAVFNKENSNVVLPYVRNLINITDNQKIFSQKFLLTLLYLWFQVKSKYVIRNIEAENR